LVVVEDAKDALKLLWILVISAAVLGIVFLLGSRGVGPFASSEYAAGTGRASLSFSLPYLGSLVINPASAGDKFAMAFSVAWFLLLTSATGPRRLAAGAAACVFAAVVVTAQGRTGLIACVLSVAMLGVWAMRRGSGERLVALSATAAGLALTIGLSFYLIFQSQNASYAARILLLFSAPQNDASLVWRVQKWITAFGIAESHPLGLGLFSPPYGADSTWLTHNLWLFLALSFGWLGLAGVVLILVRFGRVFIAGFRSADADGARLSVLGLVLLGDVLVTGMMSPLVWEPYSAVLVWVPLWIAFAGVVRCNAGLSTGGHHR
jgi:O-antigen ligase